MFSKNILAVCYFEHLQHPATPNCLIFYGKLTHVNVPGLPFPTTDSPKISFWCTNCSVVSQLQEISKFKPIQARHIVFLYIPAHAIFTCIAYIYIYTTRQREMHQMFLVVSAPFFPRLKADDIVDHIRTPLLGPHSHGSNLDADARFFHQEDQQFHHMTCIITII